MKTKTKLLIIDAFFSTILSSILILLLSIAFFNLSFFNPVKKALTDFDFLDVYYAENLNRSSEIDTDIIIINIEQRGRHELANLIRSVTNENPSVVGLDIIYRDKKETASDSTLKTVIANDKIIFAYEFKNDELINNHPYFRNVNDAGYVNFNFDQETSVIREFIGIDNRFQKDNSSFPVEIAKKYLGNRWEQLGYDKKLRRLQTIKFHGNNDSFLTFGFDEFMESNNKTILKDKIVILGYLGTPTGNVNDVEDKYFTPMNTTTAGKSIPDMYGAVVHANIVRMLINNDFLYRVSNFWIGVLAFLTMFLSSIYYIKINNKYKISYRTRKNIYLFIFSLVFIVLTLWLFKQGIIINSFPIILAAFLAGGYFKYYKHLVRYVKTKRKWKTYIK
jgi:CHASE2 domain-containing sensor protein